MILAAVSRTQLIFSFILLPCCHMISWGIGQDPLKGRESYDGEPHNHFSPAWASETLPYVGGTLRLAFF